MSISHRAVGRRLSLLAAASSGVLSVLGAAGAATLALAPTPALAFDDCGPAQTPDPTLCASGVYPNGITYVGNGIDLVLEDAVLVPSQGVILAAFTGDVTLRSGVVFGGGYVEVADGVTLLSFDGDVGLDLTAGAPDGSISGLNGVTAFGSNTDLNLGRVQAASFQSDTNNIFATGYAIFAQSTGDISISTDALLLPNYGIGIGALSDGGSITVHTTENADIIAPHTDIGLVAFGGGPIDIELNGDMGGTVGSQYRQVGVGVHVIGGYYEDGPGGDVDVVVNGDIYTSGSSPLLGIAPTIGVVNQAATGDVSVGFGLTRSAFITGGSISAAITNAANEGDVEVTIGEGSSPGLVEASSVGSGSVTVRLMDESSAVVAVEAAGDGAVEIGDDVQVGLLMPGISVTAGGRSTVTAGADLLVVSDAPGIGLRAVSTAAADDGAPSVDVSLGENASFLIQDFFGGGSTGLLAQATGAAGSVRVSAADGLSLTMMGGGDVGIAAQTELGDIDMALSAGSISVSGGFFLSSPIGQAVGLFASSDGGDVSVASGVEIGVFHYAVGGSATGIIVDTGGDGDITITNSGDITAHPEILTSQGILAQSEDGDITLTSSGAVSAGDRAVTAFASGGGAVDVTVDGALQAATGISAGSGFGDVTVTTGVDGDITSTGFGFGIAAESGGSVTVVANGDISGSFGAVTARRVTYVDGPSGPNDPPPPVIPGDVDVTVNGNITVTSLFPAIAAQNDATTGAVTVRFGTGDAAALTVASGAGVLASITRLSNTDAVTVEIGAGADIEASVGISAYNAGSGATSVATAEGSVITAQNAAILVTTDEGMATATLGGSVTSATAAAVQMDSQGGAILNIGEDALLQGATVLADIEAGGAVTIINAGAIQTTAGGLSDALFAIEGASLSLSNTGEMTGAVDLGGVGSSVLTNGGTWRTSGESDLTAGDDDFASSGTLATRATTIIDFGAGEDAFANTGALIVGDSAGASALTFAGLESFANAELILFGSIDGVETDGETNDRLVADGADYFGDGGVLAMDVDLGAGVQASCAQAVVADCLSLVGGSTSGTTQIRVTDTGTSEGALNAGIVLIDVAGGTSAAEHFVLDPASSLYRDDPLRGGVLAKGLIIYSLDYDAANQQHRLVGEADLNTFEFAPLAASVQSVWHAGANRWFDHQADLRDTGSRRSGGWVRAIGSSSDRDVIQPLTAGLVADASYEQQTVGLVAGVDLVVNDALSAGLMLGTLDSDVDFKASSTRQALEGSSYGAYAAWSSERLFVDALAQVNDLDLEHRPLTAAGGVEGEVRSLGVEVEAGALLGFAGVDVEPLVGLAYVRTSFDDLTLQAAELQTDDATSLRGSLGARVGGGVDLGGARLHLSGTGRFWEEFEGDNQATLLAGAERVALTDDVGGSFGELGAGMTLTSASGAVSFFANAGGAFGDDYRSTDATIGFRLQW